MSDSPTPAMTPALHPTLAHRPTDPRRNLPIPAMNMPPGSQDPAEADFTAIHAQTVYENAQARLCGICAAPLGYWIAFVGGPKSAQARTYIDPPFCVPCAEAALTLCPHLAISRHKRATAQRLADDVHTPEGFIEDKPEEIVMGLTRDFKTSVTNQGVIFRPAPFKRLRRFTHNDQGILTEQP